MHTPALSRPQSACGLTIIGCSRLLSALLLGMVALGGWAGATTYYVDLAGTDGAGRSGSSSQPFRTLYYASTRAVTAGDLIRVGVGMFQESTTAQINPGVSVDGAGQTLTTITCVANPVDPVKSWLITLGSWNADIPVQGNQSISNLTLDGNTHAVHQAIGTGARSNLTFHDLTFQNFSLNGLNISGSYTPFLSVSWPNNPPPDSAYCTNIQILHCTFLNGAYCPSNTDWAYGDIGFTGVKDSVIRNCAFDETTYGGWGIKGSWFKNSNVNNCTFKINPAYPAVNNFSVEIWYTDTCQLFDNWATGGFSIGMNNNLHIHHNEIVCPAGVNAGLAVEFGGYNSTVDHNWFDSVCGVDVWGGPYNNCTIAHNVFRNGTSAIFTRSADGTLGAVSNLHIYNNTLDNSGTLYNGGPISLNAQGANLLAGTQIKNNIVANTTVARAAVTLGGQNLGDTFASYVNGTVITNNLFYNNASGNISQTASVVGTVTSPNTVANPLFKSGFNTAPSPYYELQSGSPALGAGVDVGLPYLGSAPDIGAFVQQIGQRIEAEMNFSTAVDMGVAGAVSVATLNLDSNKCVLLPDNGDSIRIHFKVPTDGYYNVAARVRSGSWTVATNSDQNPTSMFSNYVWLVDGDSASFTGDVSSVSAPDPSGGGVYWGTMRCQNVYLTEGLHNVQISMTAAGGMADYLEVTNIGGGNTYKWNGASSGNLNDGAQWTPAGTPASGNEYDIETPGAVVSQTANVNVSQLMVGSASGAPDVLNITNQITSSDTIAAGSSWYFNNAQGTINHTAGAIVTYNPGDALWIMVGCSTGSSGNVGTYNFGGASPGPSINATGGSAVSSGIAIGGNAGNHGVMSLSGYGTLNIPSEPIYIGTRDSRGLPGGNGVLNITGGNLTINAGVLYAGGHFLSDHGPWAAGSSTAALNVTIDSTGISAINAPTVQIDSLATFSVNLSGVTPTAGTVYTIINSTNSISGTFASLPEGSYLRSGSTWFKASYLGSRFTITAVAPPTSLPPLLEEGFNYTIGNSVDGTSQNGGTGFASASSWSADAVATVGTGLSYPGLATAGAGALHSTAYGTTTRSIAPFAGSVYYMGMLINMHGHETTRCGPELQNNGQDGCMFGRVNGGWGMFSGGGNFGISSSGGAYHAWKGVTVASDNNTHLLVYKFDSIAKTVSIWVDPTVSTTIPAPNAILQTGTVDPTSGHSGTWTVNLGTSFNDIRLWHDAPCDIDELRFGAFWQAVLPAPPSTVSTLSGLALSSGTLSPTFATGTTSYTASVPNAASSITVTPTVTNSAASVTVNGTSVTSGVASLPITLSVGSNTITTVVTAQDGVTTSTYIVTVTRALSTASTLSGLALSSGTLSPNFTTGTTGYTASVPNATSSITVTPTVTNSAASVTVNGTSVTSGVASLPITLSVGSNTITTVVTAQDGVTISTYTATVTRAAPSTVATLSALALSSGTLSPTFATGTTSYTASVPNAMPSITVTPTVTNSAATVTVNGTNVASGFASGSIPLALGSNTITTVVTAQDGVTTSTYTVTVTRAPSSVSTLSALALSSGTLSPSFATGTTSYTASVSNATTSLTVTPTVTNSTATVTVNGTSVTSGSASGSISLLVGTNTITTIVTAQDGVATSTYTVTVTRAPSTVSTLSGLALSSGALSPTFATGTTSYTQSVSNVTSSLTLTPTVTDSTATVTVNGTTVASGSASGLIALSVGSNTITTVVTAQDGVTTSTYTVTVTRDAPPAHSISGTVTLGGTGLAGVTVSDGTRTATTDGSGAYTITSVPDPATYTVTPSLTGYTFTPASLSVTLSGSDVTGKDFAVANAFGNWATIHGLSGANAAATANPSHDGLSNLVKYALDLNPAVSAQPAGTHNGNSLSFTKGAMAKADSALTYSIEESTDLVTWSAPSLGSSTNGADTISYTFPSGQPRVFARLKVIQTP